MEESKDDFGEQDENACGYESEDDSLSLTSSSGSFDDWSNVVTGGGSQVLDEEDPDALEDPIYHINLQKYLSDFCHSLQQQPCFDSFVSHLNPKECSILHKIGIEPKMSS